MTSVPKACWGGEKVRGTSAKGKSKVNKEEEVVARKTVSEGRKEEEEGRLY